MMILWTIVQDSLTYKSQTLNQTKQKNMKVVIPVYLPSSSKDLDLSKIASRSRLTECIDITFGSTLSTFDRGFLCLVLSAMALIILGAKVFMSMPSKT